jgi:hypothetical protein
MPRQDTRLESEGAEFLVLGHLLIHGIPAYKTYTNMPGYDLVATAPEHHSSARIQVKSRWRTGAPGFLLKNLDHCDFVVVAKLNRGKKGGGGKVLPPEFFVFPAAVLKGVPRTEKWKKVMFRDIPEMGKYREKWDLIRVFLTTAKKTS